MNLTDSQIKFLILVATSKNVMITDPKNHSKSGLKSILHFINKSLLNIGADRKKYSFYHLNDDLMKFCKDDLKILMPDNTDRIVLIVSNLIDYQNVSNYITNDIDDKFQKFEQYVILGAYENYR